MTWQEVKRFPTHPEKNKRFMFLIISLSGLSKFNLVEWVLLLNHDELKVSSFPSFIILVCNFYLVDLARSIRFPYLTMTNSKLMFASFHYLV